MHHILYFIKKRCLFPMISLKEYWILSPFFSSLAIIVIFCGWVAFLTDTWHPGFLSLLFWVATQSGLWISGLTINGLTEISSPESLLVHTWDGKCYLIPPSHCSFLEMIMSISETSLFRMGSWEHPAILQ